LAGAHGSLAPELMHQLLAGGASNECPNNIRVSYVGELGALLGETPDEVSKGLARLLATAREIPGVTGVYVCALEVPNKDLNQVCPIMDQSFREVP